MTQTTQLSDIRTRVRLYLDDASFDGVAIDRAINDYINQLTGTHEFSFLETSQDVTLGAAANTMSWPSDMQRLLALINRTGIYSGLNYFAAKRYVDYDNFVQLYPTPDLAVPSPPYWYTTFNNTVVWNAPADQAYTFRFQYLKSPTKLTNDVDVCIIPDEFIECVVLGAYHRLVKRDDDYDIAKAEAPDILALEVALINRYGRGRAIAGPRRMMSSFRG